MNFDRVRADVDRDGVLSRDEFAVAFSLARERIGPRGAQARVGVSDTPATPTTPTLEEGETAVLADQYFDTLDRQQRGVIPGHILVNFFTQFGLSAGDLASIRCAIIFSMLDALKS